MQTSKLKKFLKIMVCGKEKGRERPIVCSFVRTSFMDGPITLDQAIQASCFEVQLLTSVALMTMFMVKKDLIALGLI